MCRISLQNSGWCGLVSLSLLIYLLPLPLPSIGSSLEIRSRSIATFVGNLSLHRYQDCALFFLRQDGGQVGQLGDDILVEVMTRVGLVAYYNAVYSTGVEDPGANGSIHFKESVANYNRKASVCKMVIGTVDDVSPKFLDRIKQ